MFVSLDLYKKGEKHAENANQYDLMTSDAVYPVSVEGSKDTRMAANVFTAQADEYLFFCVRASLLRAMSL